MSKIGTKCLEFIFTYGHAKTNSDQIFFFVFSTWGAHQSSNRGQIKSHACISSMVDGNSFSSSFLHMNDQHIQIVFHACRYCGSLLLQDAWWLIFVVEFALDKIFDVQLCHVVDNVSIKTLVKENKRYST